MLQLLVDEHCITAIATQLVRHRPRASIITMQKWEDGNNLSAEDEAILLTAYVQSLTLVTYDQTTIPPLIKRWAEEGRSHAGIVFLDHRSFPQRNAGPIVSALIRLWDEAVAFDWTDRVHFLRPVTDI